MLSPNGSSGTLLQESAMLGRFLAGRAGPADASGVGCDSGSWTWCLQEAGSQQDFNSDVSGEGAPQHQAP